MPDDETTFRDRVTRQGEEAIGKIAQELLESPVVSSALSAAFETRERAMRAQEVAMGALNLPSAGDLERLTRRVRSVSQRLEGIEDGLDRLDDRLARNGSTQSLEQRLTRIEELLGRLEPERAPAPAAPRAAGPGSPARSTAVTRAKSAAAKTAGGAAGPATPRPRAAGPATPRPRTPPPAGG
jgi:TolA-binding protein